MCEFECSAIGIFRRLLVLIHMYHYLNVVFLRFLQVVHICLIHLFFLKTEDNSWCTCCFYNMSTLILHCSQEIQLLYNICFYFLLFSVICDLFTKLLICNYTVFQLLKIIFGGDLQVLKHWEELLRTKYMCRTRCI